MPQTDANLCQICGDALFHDDVFSDPSQHFCISVDGPAMSSSHVDSSDQVRRVQDHSIENYVADSWPDQQRSTRKYRAYVPEIVTEGGGFGASDESQASTA